MVLTQIHNPLLLSNIYKITLQLKCDTYPIVKRKYFIKKLILSLFQSYILIVMTLNEGLRSVIKFRTLSASFRKSFQ